MQRDACLKEMHGDVAWVLVHFAYCQMHLSRMCIMLANWLVADVHNAMCVPLVRVCTRALKAVRHKYLIGESYEYTFSMCVCMCDMGYVW